MHHLQTVRGGTHLGHTDTDTHGGGDDKEVDLISEANRLGVMFRGNLGNPVLGAARLSSDLLLSRQGSKAQTWGPDRERGSGLQHLYLQ